MRILPASATEAILEATLALDRGGVVLLPTEAGYCAAADALEEGALLLLREATGHPPGDPLTAGVGGLEEVRHVARLTPLARRLWESEPATLLLPAAEHLPSTATAGGGAVPVRLLQHPFARSLASHFGPLALSAGGTPSLRSAPGAARAALGIDGGEIAAASPRTLDARGASPVGGPGRQPS